MKTLQLSFLLVLFASNGQDVQSRVDFSLARTNNDFAFAVYKDLASTHRDPILFSPLSILSAMSMLMLGARGKTRDEMFTGLSYAKYFANANQAHAAFAHLGNQRISPQNKLEMANRILINRSFRTQYSYVESLRRHYHANISRIDLRNKEATVSRVNRWVTRQTHGRISRLLDNVGDNAALILLNAVYFKANWADPFMTSKNFEGTFNGADGVPRRTLFMSKLARSNYMVNSELGFRILAIPYKENAASFCIILPNPEQSLDTLMSRLTIAELESSLSSLREELVSLKMPKFSLEDKIDLRTLLPRLGITSVFDAQAADLSGISGTNDGLHASQALTKTVIEVTEKGTEAAAVSGIETSTRSGGNIPSFNVNRPFVYLIREPTQGAIYFMGRVV